MNQSMNRDRYNRVVERDDQGLRFVVLDGFAFYITDCCDASAKGSMGEVVCRACYREIDPALGGLPTVNSKAAS
jgi:hypothetical protein